MNWTKARDWEVIEGARQGWDGAIAEAAARGLTVVERDWNGGRYLSGRSVAGPVNLRRKAV